MRDTLINKYKLDIVQTIKSIFINFPDIEKIDLIIKKSSVKNIITNNEIDTYFMYFNTFLNLNNFTDTLEINQNSKIKGLEKLSFGKEEILVFNWDVFENLNLSYNNQFIKIKNINGDYFDFDKFYKNILNIEFLNNQSFLSAFFKQEQYLKPDIISINYSFFKNKNYSSKEFLGDYLYSLNEKNNIEQTINNKNINNSHSNLVKL